MLIKENGMVYDQEADLAKFCDPLGITRHRWDFSSLDNTFFAQDLSPEVLCEKVVEEVSSPLTAFKQAYGYQTQDLVRLTPQTPEIEAMLTRFEAVHHHTDDEVRAIADGEGIFGIERPDGSRFEIVVSKGDVIIVPAYTRHWFTLTEKRSITALRVFQDKAGWTPIYEPANLATS